MFLPEFKINTRTGEKYAGFKVSIPFETVTAFLSKLWRRVFGGDEEQKPLALPKLRKITPARDGWKFDAYIDGDDIVMFGVRATCFGGANDPQDNGKTASGILTKGNPGLEAVSLPMDYRGQSRSTKNALWGSPIPLMPFGLKSSGADNPAGCWVTVSRGGKSFRWPCIDLGPAHRTGNAIDLTIAAARKFAPQASATNFSAIVDVRIHGGAKFLTS